MESAHQTPEESVPFEPQAADLGGCGKPAVIGCLVVLVLLAIGFAVFLFKVADMLDWALAQYETRIVTNLSSDVALEDKERLESAFASARVAIREKRFDPEALQELQRFMASPPDLSEPVGPDEVRDLIEVLEMVGKSAPGFSEGVEPADPGPTAVLLAYSRDACV